LTRAGDIIRSRTYDAFFPLLAVAAVYLVTTGLFIWLFDVVDKVSSKKKSE
jgi:ABC-type arginine/histidine transport system permease subunit